jgi:hypothetical protein
MRPVVVQGWGPRLSRRNVAALCIFSRALANRVARDLAPGARRAGRASDEECHKIEGPPYSSHQSAPQC